jgi:hypothetical protein
MRLLLGQCERGHSFISEIFIDEVMQEGYKQLKILLMMYCCLASSGANSVDIIRNILSHFSILVLVRSKFQLGRVLWVNFDGMSPPVMYKWYGLDFSFSSVFSFPKPYTTCHYACRDVMTKRPRIYHPDTFSDILRPVDDMSHGLYYLNDCPYLDDTLRDC